MLSIADQQSGLCDTQVSIPRIDQMPNLPPHLKIRDWRKTTRDFCSLAFDTHADGQYLPLVWIQRSASGAECFGLDGYVTDEHPADSQEGICCIPAVLSGALVGADMRSSAHDWVALSLAFFDSSQGNGVVQDHVHGGLAGSFWYDLWPALAFDGLAHYYPDAPGLSHAMRATADRWLEATDSLKGADGVPNFDHTGFSLKQMTPVDNGKWKEPDGASGVSYLEYLAYARYGDRKYLDAARACQSFLDRRESNPHYEILSTFGAYTAARMNAEAGAALDVAKQVAWTFEPGPTRPRWGAIVGNWGGYEASGLIGSVADADGYGFAMNTFAPAAALVPLTRYDQRFARAIGKWMLNAASAARLFYPDELSAVNQSCPQWKGDPSHCIAYEGVRKHPRHDDAGPSPYASGDPLTYHWHAKTDFGVYGSAHVGIFGGIVGRTSDPAILLLDCLKTDYFHAPAYPTCLAYNPYDRAKTFSFDVGPYPKRVYSLTGHKFITQRSAGVTSFTLAAGTADVYVLCPQDASSRVEGAKRTVGGVVVDYRAGAAE